MSNVCSILICITFDILDKKVYTLDIDVTYIKQKIAVGSFQALEEHRVWLRRATFFSACTSATSLVLASIIATATTAGSNYSPPVCRANSTESAFCCLSWRPTNRAIGWYCWARTCRAPARRDRGGWRGTARLRDHAEITHCLQRIAKFLKLTGTTH